MRLAVTVLGLVVSGCFSPKLPATSCSEEQSICPQGLVCVDGECREFGDPADPDANVGSPDASADASDFVETLVNRELLVRYFMDEAATGTDPSALRDSAPDPFDLVVEYDGNMSFDTRGDNRVLQWDQPEEAGACARLVQTSKVRTELQGLQELTIEIVGTIQDIANDDSVLLWLGDGGDVFGDLDVRVTEGGLITVALNNRAVARYDPPDLMNDRFIMHILLDSEDIDPNERIQLFFNGDEVNPQIPGVTVLQDENLAVGNNQTSLLIGNRDPKNASMTGSLGYVAIYKVELEDDELDTNRLRLTQGDDTTY